MKIKIIKCLLIIFITIFFLVFIDFCVIRPYIAEIYALRGKSSLYLNNFQEAISNFEYAAELDPYNGRVILNLGATYLNTGFLNKSEIYLNKAKQIYSDGNINLDLGLLYLERGEYEKAKMEIEHSIYLKPNFSKARFNLGRLYYIQEKYDQAIKEWEELLNFDPEFSGKHIILFNLGIVYNKKEIPDKALEYFLQALQLAPDGSPIIEEIEGEIYNIYKDKLEE